MLYLFIALSGILRQLHDLTSFLNLFQNWSQHLASFGERGERSNENQLVFRSGYSDI